MHGAYPALQIGIRAAQFHVHHQLPAVASDLLNSEVWLLNPALKIPNVMPSGSPDEWPSGSRESRRTLP